MEHAAFATSSSLIPALEAPATVGLMSPSRCPARVPYLCQRVTHLAVRMLQITLRRLSEALRSIDLQEISQSGQMETGLGLEALDGSSVESINSNLDVSYVGCPPNELNEIPRCSSTQHNAFPHGTCFRSKSSSFVFRFSQGYVMGRLTGSARFNSAQTLEKCVHCLRPLRERLDQLPSKHTPIASVFYCHTTGPWG